MDKERKESAPKIEPSFSTYEFEATQILDKDAMGREKFWEDLGRQHD
jgi:hypothetical protein